MATITLEYDARNTVAKKFIDLILSMSIFTVKKEETNKVPSDETEIKNSLHKSLNQAMEIKRTKSVKGLKKLDEIL